MLDLSQPKNAHIDERLRSEHIIWLSSVKQNGEPHMVPVWFLWDGKTILIFSQPNTQKMRNLQHDRRVMLALNTTPDGGEVLMIKGTAELGESADMKNEIPALAEKYKQEIQDFGWTAESMLQDYSKAIRVTPVKFLSYE